MREDGREEDNEIDRSDSQSGMSLCSPRRSHDLPLTAAAAAVVPVEVAASVLEKWY
uniref:VAN3-binding protein-like auxin canalisation domain-containing protein n=1 Tax=Setaria digitata TaxID=48799 RepID=A0A915PLT6_9BILA